MISSNNFLDEIKIADFIPVYKGQNVSDKSKYRPISLLPIIPQMFEKVFYSHLETVTNKIFSPKLCGFRKGHSSQNALLNLLKNWQKCLDISGVVETVLTDLSKT